MGFAILIFFTYIELAIAGKALIVRGAMPASLGLWWVHAVMIVFGAAVLAVPRWLARLRYRRNMSGAAAVAVPA